jgi:hypothetical protein
MNLLIKGILLGVLGQVLSFLQLQAQFKYSWIKENGILFSCLVSVPISLCFYYSVQSFVNYGHGQIWMGRILGQGIGVLVFTAMTLIMFKEPLTVKTSICVVLGICIILIQIFWKQR